ncbi:MAG: tetratricopeptide repeat protein [Candidatus Competibacteraceae bacterium]|nr:tetratricopeptide repeat protein [Candidatus Competibacteraceae bacterium]
MNKQFIRIIALLTLYLISGNGITTAYAQKNKKNKKSNAETAVNYDADRVKFTNMFGEALTQKIIGNQNNALKKLYECHKLWPHNEAVNYEIATLYMIDNKYEMALPYMEVAVKSDPSNKWYLMGYIEILKGLKKDKECEKVFKDLIKLEPENTDHILDLADYFMMQKKYKEAIALFDELEKKTGVHAEISLQKQKLYKALGKTQASLDEVLKLIRFYPNNAQYYGILAEVYLEINKKDDALKAYQKVLELEPDNPIIHLALANFYQEKGDQNKSWEHITQAFQNPDVEVDDKVQVLLSYYEISQNNKIRKEQAYELIHILTEMHPKEAKAYAIKGDFLIRDRRYAEAIEAFEKVNEIDKSRYPVWEQLLRLYYDAQNWEMLSIRSHEASELFPLQPMTFLYAGISLGHLQKYKEALIVLETGKEMVLDARDLKSEFFVVMADCYFHLKQFEDMEIAYENALMLDPLNMNAKNNYAYNLALSGRKLEKAHSLITDVLKSQPKNLYYLDTYAIVLFEQGQYEKARSVIEEALRYGGDKYGTIVEHYGDILFKSGQPDLALEMWNKAKIMGGELSDSIDKKISSKQWTK